jgi:hypothetical protein
MIGKVCTVRAMQAFFSPRHFAVSSHLTAPDEPELTTP